MINAYDFDKTIYDGDSTIDFYLYCLKRKKSIIFLIPIQVWGLLLYIIKVKEKEYFKEKFFVFLRKLKNVDNYVEEFWNKNDKKIKNWYLNQKKPTDIIISASPMFLLEPICTRLNVNKVIASVVDKKTGKFLSKNCHDVEKVNRFKTECKNVDIDKFYSDSLSDEPMMKISKEAYLVDGDIIRKT